MRRSLSDVARSDSRPRLPRPDLLREALTHRSALQGEGAAGRGSNERLEFIGDRVLGLLIAEWLAERFPHEQEGDWGGAWPIWCRSRCWPMWRRRSVWRGAVGGAG